MKRIASFIIAFVISAVTAGFAAANCKALDLLEAATSETSTAVFDRHDSHSHEHHSDTGPAVHCPNPFDHFVISRPFAPNHQQAEFRFLAPSAMTIPEAYRSSHSPSRGPPRGVALFVPEYLFFSVLRI